MDLLLYSSNKIITTIIVLCFPFILQKQKEDCREKERDNKKRDNVNAICC